VYRLYLSLQFLRHHWLMTLIGSFFVGASLVILVVVMAVMDGFQARLRDTVSGASADFMVTPRFPVDLEKLAESLKSNVPQVVASSPFEQTLTFVRRTGRVDPLEDKLEYAQVYGVDGWREQSVNRFGEYLHALERGRGRGRLTVRDAREPFKVDKFDEVSGTRGVILSSGLRRSLRVNVGDLVRIAALRRKAAAGRDGSGVDDYEQDWLTYRVVGIHESGNSEEDAHGLFLDWKVVQELWSDDLRRSSVRCRLTDPEQYSAARRALQQRIDRVIFESKLPGATVSGFDAALLPESWRDKHATLVRAIESEKSMILIIAFLIVVAGTSSIFAAQWLLVSDKVREIGILRALGAGVEGVMSIFVFNGLCMGFLGSVGGALVGLLVVDRIDTVHELVKVVTGRDVFDPSIYLFEKIPTQVDYDAVVHYAAAALVCTLVASAIPALRAGLMDPAKALHRE
jgi:lipoprotein-releasing system permease protein